MAAPLAADAFTPLKCWVLDAFGIYLDVFRTHRKVSSVNAVVHLIVLLCALVTVAEFAFKLEEIPAFFSLVLPSFEHVVALRAEADAFKLSGFLWLGLRPLGKHTLLIIN